MLRNHGGGHAPVSNLELFFDLVYVFAITQISQFLHIKLSWTGLIQGTLLFIAVWWAWIYTTWVANWANPDRLPVRILLLTLMLLSLAMAVAMPRAFEDRALIFAGSYLALQIGRTLCMAWFFHGENNGNALNMVRIAVWFAYSAPLWLAGAWLGGGAQLGCWGLALAIEYAGPLAFFRVPGLGRSSLANWNISGSHMAERCALFIIIALGEGIVVTGATFVGLSVEGGAMESGRVAGFIAAFLGSALMWWLYFDLGAERGARMITGHEQAGRVARNAYTYLHMPIVLGIVLCAVGDAFLMDDWDKPASHALVLVQCGGALVFLGGMGLFKRSTSALGNLPLSHGVAMILYTALGIRSWLVPVQTLELACWGVGILFVTAVWEWVSYHGGWIERMEARGWPLATSLRRRTDARNAARIAKRD